MVPALAAALLATSVAAPQQAAALPTSDTTSPSSAPPLPAVGASFAPEAALPSPDTPPELLTGASGYHPLRFTWPLVPTRIQREFDPPATPYGRGHRGVDLAGVTPQQVLAAGPGVVTWSGTINSVGSLTITHANGLRTTYLPLATRTPLGTPVVAGQPIGTIAPGHCLGICLHWGAYTKEGLKPRKRYVDPTLLPGFSPELKPDAGPLRGPRTR